MTKVVQQPSHFLEISYKVTNATQLFFLPSPKGSIIRTVKTIRFFMDIVNSSIHLLEHQAKFPSGMVLRWYHLTQFPTKVPWSPHFILIIQMLPCLGLRWYPLTTYPTQVHFSPLYMKIFQVCPWQGLMWYPITPHLTKVPLNPQLMRYFQVCSCQGL